MFTWDKNVSNMFLSLIPSISLHMIKKVRYKTLAKGYNRMKVRIKFAKYGAMKFIGHLDMMRFFQKAVRRAEIDVKYSEGFSPHQIMSFAAPLGVGIESLGEYMDLEVLSMSAPEDMKDALNRVMVEGVEVLAVNILPDQAKNAMASVAAASYQIHLKEGNFGLPDLAAGVASFYAQKQIPYIKETKKSVIETDLKPGIYELQAGEAQVLADSMSAAAAMTVAGSVGNRMTAPCIRMLVDASSGGNIKPTVVFEEFCSFAGCDIPVSDIQVTRLDTYTNLAKDGEPRQFPLTFHLVEALFCP